MSLLLAGLTCVAENQDAPEKQVRVCTFNCQVFGLLTRTLTLSVPCLGIVVLYQTALPS